MIILPSDNAMGSLLPPQNIIGTIISHDPIAPNQINTNKAYFDPRGGYIDPNRQHNMAFDAGFYYILKPGPLQFILNLDLDGEGNDVIREKVQFNLTATS
jgi:hypothetical protein